MTNYLSGKTAFPNGTVISTSIPSGPNRYILTADSNGLNGFVWDIDPIGPIGDAGPTGPTGPQGPYGNRGADGIQGIAGTTGPVGNAGIAGGFTPSVYVNNVAGITLENNTKVRLFYYSNSPAVAAAFDSVIIGGVLTAQSSTGTFPTGPNIVSFKTKTVSIVTVYEIEFPLQGTGFVAGNVSNVIQASYFLPGPTGAVGDDGAIGNQGAVGAVGPAGALGLNGDKGGNGDVGAVGNKGPLGFEGKSGDVGEQGNKGNAGAASQVQGPQGPKGVDGLAGPPGNEGKIGGTLTGPIGKEGAAGPDGDKGETGDKGGYVAPTSFSVSPPQYSITLAGGTFTIYVFRSLNAPSFWNSVINGGVITTSGGSGSLPSGPNIVTNKYSQSGGFFNDWYISGTTSGAGGNNGSWGTLTQAAYFIPGPAGPAGPQGAMGRSGNAGSSDPVGIVPFANDSARDASSYPIGTMSFTLDEELLWVKNSYGWSRYPGNKVLLEYGFFPSNFVDYTTIYLDSRGWETDDIELAETTLLIINQANPGPYIGGRIVAPALVFNDFGIVIEGSYFLCGRGGYAGLNTVNNARFSVAGGGGGGGTSIGVPSGGAFPTGNFAQTSWVSQTFYPLTVATVQNGGQTYITTRNGVQSVQNGGDGCPTQLQFVDGVFNLDGKPGACGGGAAWINSNASSKKGGRASQSIQGGNGFDSAIQGQPLAGLTALGGGGGGGAITSGGAWSFGQVGIPGWVGGEPLTFITHYTSLGQPQAIRVGAGGNGQLQIAADGRNLNICQYGRGGGYQQTSATGNYNTPYNYSVFGPQQGVIILRLPTYRRE